MANPPESFDPFVVVIAMDGKDLAMNAFNFYVKYIHREENYVILAHAMKLPTMPTREDWEKTHKAARRASIPLESKFSSLLTENELNGKVEDGLEKPGEFILETAKTNDAKLIVMGCRGMGGLKRTLLGSVSDHVMHHAPCPVLVVRK